MDSLLQDIRYALRTFIAHRSVTLVAVLVLALGIGATTTIYSVVEGVLLRPLSYANPDRLVDITRIQQKQYVPGRWGEQPTMAEFRALRAQSHSFEDLSVYEGDDPVLTGLGDATRISAWSVMSNLFPLLGVRPTIGRGFTADEDALGSAPVVVLSDAFWATRFGRDPHVLGRSLTLDGTDYRIVGVMPPEFHFPALPSGFRSDGADVWRSMGATPSMLRTDGKESIWLVGRLRPTVTIPQASADLDVVLHRLSRTDPQLEHMVAIVMPLREMMVGDVRPALLVALAAVGLVLLIACANVANLLLARAAARRREMAVRIALGASRLRIVRQLLTEAVLLSLAGAATGVLLAAWGVPLLVSLAGRELPRIHQVGIDLHVLAITVVVALLTALLFGLAPALQSVRGISPAALKEGSAGSGTGAGHSRTTGAFVVAQVALTLMLLVGAGLLGRSFLGLVTIDPGFDPDHVLVAGFSLPSTRYGTKAQRLAFTNAALDRALALPGVTTAAVSTGLPLAVVSRGRIGIAGQPQRSDAPRASAAAVTPDFFRVLGIPLHRGRLLQAGDAGRADLVVVNDALTRALFPGQDPIGQRITFRGGRRSGTIIGVVGNTREMSLGAEPPPVVYEPLAADAIDIFNVIVRTAGDPAALAEPLRASLHELDPNLPIDQLYTMRERMAASLTTQRFYTALLGIFSTLALLMAAAGLYALVSYTVVRRTRELGIRMALGAVPRDVLRLIVRRGALLASTGIAIGIGGALAATRVLESFLFEITPTDPAVFAGVAVGLGIVALIASYLPARRATRIDPVAVLRDE